MSSLFPNRSRLPFLILDFRMKPRTRRRVGMLMNVIMFLALVGIFLVAGLLGTLFYLSRQ